MTKLEKKVEKEKATLFAIVSQQLDRHGCNKNDQK